MLELLGDPRPIHFRVKRHGYPLAICISTETLVELLNSADMHGLVDVYISSDYVSLDADTKAQITVLFRTPIETADKYDYEEYA